MQWHLVYVLVATASGHALALITHAQQSIVVRSFAELHAVLPLLLLLLLCLQAGDISGTTSLVKDLVGVGTLLYAAFVWLLLDAADRDRLGASTFRALNGACCAVSLLVGASCIAGQADGIATNLTNQTVVLVSCLATAGVFGYQALQPSTKQ